MTILDELAAMARERHYGHEPVERALCYVSKLPVDWCLGCKRGWHKFTQQPLPGTEPDYCPVCTPQGFGSCRCHIASNE